MTLVNRPSQLTEQHRRLLRLSMQGLDVHQIAREMRISIDGVYSFKVIVTKELGAPDFATALKIFELLGG